MPGSNNTWGIPLELMALVSENQITVDGAKHDLGEFTE
jgi:hypothetical protein